MLADDVGNWLEPLGVVSICSESLAVAAAIAALVQMRDTSRNALWLRGRDHQASAIAADMCGRLRRRSQCRSALLRSVP